MNKVKYDENPIVIERGPSYSKIESISPSTRKKAKERLNNPNRKSSKHFLKDFFSERGVHVYPKRMTYWYKYTKKVRS
jgi:hypothetical protein